MEESPVSLQLQLEAHLVLGLVDLFALLLTHEEHILALLPILEEHLMALQMILEQKYLLLLPLS